MGDLTCSHTTRTSVFFVNRDYARTSAQYAPHLKYASARQYLRNSMTQESTRGVIIQTRYPLSISQSQPSGTRTIVNTTTVVYYLSGITGKRWSVRFRVSPHNFSKKQGANSERYLSRSKSSPRGIFQAPRCAWPSRILSSLF